MEASSFARLSPELRNLIYSFAFTNSGFAITLKADNIQHGLTRTCRQLRRETLKLYYSLARFNAHLDDGPATPLARWLTTIGRENVLLLNEVNVWDMHMLNATLHGAESTARLMDSAPKAADGHEKHYFLHHTGSWLFNRGWYLKDLVIALHPMGLEIRNLSLRDGPKETVNALDAKINDPQRTSLFAIVPITPSAPACRHPELRDLLIHLGFDEGMVEEVFDGLEGVFSNRAHAQEATSLLPSRPCTDPTAVSGSTDSWREIRVRRRRQDIFLTFDGLELISTRQTFIPHDAEEFVPF